MNFAARHIKNSRQLLRWCRASVHSTVVHSNYRNSKNSQDGKSSNKPFPFLLPAVLLFPVLHAKERIDDEESELTVTSKSSAKDRFNFIADVVDQVAPAIVQIQIRQTSLFGQHTVGSGSGFVVSSDGHVLTNAHVIQRVNHEQVIRLNDGRTFTGRVVRLDKQADLALLKIESVTHLHGCFRFSLNRQF
jgi:S1-C subfamily serine protease